jgi:hypothetical protein
MTTLSQEEREDLQNVFTSISEVKPARFPKLDKLKNIIYTTPMSRIFSISKKRVSYQK